MNEFNFCDENIKKDIDIVARDLLIQEQYQEIAELSDRIAELEQAQCKPLSFSDYETIVDINNHNYGRYEALIDGCYIKEHKDND